MTAVLAVALLFCAPIPPSDAPPASPTWVISHPVVRAPDGTTHRLETRWPPSTSALIAAPPTTSLPPTSPSDSRATPVSVETDTPAPPESPPITIAQPEVQPPPPSPPAWNADPPAEPPTLQEIVLAKLPPVFLRIVPCESSWNVWAVGPFGERSLAQIHPLHAAAGGAIERAGWTWADMHNPVANIDVAAVLYRESGLAPWASSRRCWG